MPEFSIPSDTEADWPAVRALLAALGVAPLEALPSTLAPHDQRWHTALDLLGPFSATHPGLTAAPEWSLPYSPLLDGLLRRFGRVVDQGPASTSLRSRQVLAPLLAPRGVRRELQQSQQLLPLPHTRAALESADGLTVLRYSGYLPDRPVGLFFLQCGLADWQRPDAPGAEPRLIALWHEVGLWLETVEGVPHFAELTFAGARSAASADDFRAHLLGGQLRPSALGSTWEARIQHLDQYVIERATFHALLTGLLADLEAYRLGSRSLLGALRRWWRRRSRGGGPRWR
ncbi:MAG: hypothetical protein M5U01_11310 [Ardenticatenaceae bacterium]|nr:hypothetical protein [Ardenticatenaceae bacterium]